MEWVKWVPSGITPALMLNHMIDGLQVQAAEHDLRAHNLTKDADAARASATHLRQRAAMFRCALIEIAREEKANG